MHATAQVHSPPQCSASQASELVSFLILFKVSHGPPGGQEALCEECCGGSSIWWAWFRPLLCHSHAMFGADFLLYTQNKHLGAGVMAPSEKCLLCRHKNEFHSHTFFFFKSTMVVHAFNPTSGDVETGGFPEFSGHRAGLGQS